MTGVGGQAPQLRLGTDMIASWDGSGFSGVDDRRIESWIASLLQAEHLALLVGNGLSTAVGLLAGQTPPAMDQPLDVGAYTDAVEAYASATATDLGRTVNIEDRIRAALTLSEGLRVQGDAANAEMVQSAVDAALAGLIKGVLAFERNLVAYEDAQRDAVRSALVLLQRFLLPFASRPAGRERLGIFTTNYDRLLEFGADLLGLRILDRFSGSVHPTFSASRLDVDLHYSPPGIRGEPRLLEGVVRLGKLHGSVDWLSSKGGVFKSGLPFGADETAAHIFANERASVVYPNPSKDVETLNHPYAELFRDMAAHCCRPNSVLFTFGYGFGDSHLNRNISDMLTLPSTHLVVVSWDRPKALDRFIESSTYPSAQTTEIIGPSVGSLAGFVDFVPSLASTTFIDAQTAYADRSFRLRQALGVPPEDGPAPTTNPPF